METTIVIMKAFGIMATTASLIMLLCPDKTVKIAKDLAKNTSFYYLGGIMSLIIGAIIIAIHNVWTGGWPLLITILGWMSLVKGFVLMTYPAEIAEMEKNYCTRNAVLSIGVFAFAIGVGILYKAYFCL